MLEWPTRFLGMKVKEPPKKPWVLEIVCEGFEKPTNLAILKPVFLGLYLHDISFHETNQSKPDEPHSCKVTSFFRHSFTKFCCRNRGAFPTGAFPTLITVFLFAAKKLRQPTKYLCSHLGPVFWGHWKQSLTKCKLNPYNSTCYSPKNMNILAGDIYGWPNDGPLLRMGSDLHTSYIRYIRPAENQCQGHMHFPACIEQNVYFCWVIFPQNSPENKCVR